MKKSLLERCDYYNLKAELHYFVPKILMIQEHSVLDSNTGFGILKI